MNILVANDDGIKARGLQQLVGSLREGTGANIYVVAPSGQRSGASHSLSLGKEVAVRETEVKNAELAFALDGTPADCVAIGLKILRDKGIRIDVVFSGINNGSNVGTDILYSGTVGAALQGSVQGYPSVAVSVDGTDVKHFEYAGELAVDAIVKTGGKWDSDIVININTPDLPKDQIRGIRYTVMGEREYTDDVQVTRVEGDTVIYVYAGEPVRYDHDDETIDVLAIQNGYASVTPLHRDMTAAYAKTDVEKWRIGK